MSSERAYGQNAALAVAVISLVLLIISLAKFGADNLGDLVRLGLDLMIFSLALWWLGTRKSLRWIGWVVALLTTVAVIFNLANLGLHNFTHGLVIILLFLIAVLAAGWSFRHREPDL